jgi:glyoxylase I family protein
MDSPVSGFSHLQLHVGDLGRSERWYAAALGLKRFAGTPEGGYLAMSGAGGRFAVVLSAASGNSNGDSSNGLDHLAFAVPTRELLTEWAAGLSQAGIAHDGLVTSAEGISVHLVDPDGLHIELITAQKPHAAQ